MAKNVITLLNGATAEGAGTSYQLPSMFGDVPASKFSFQAIGAVTASTGAVSVSVQVSNNNSDWITLGNISLALSTSNANDGFASDAPWAFVRGNVTTISGTNATVTLLMGA